MPMRRIRSSCCARAARGHATAEPATTLIKSRRRIAFHKTQGLRRLAMRLQQDFATGGMGFRLKLHGSNPKPLMSALGQKRTLGNVASMSAIPPNTDIG